MPKLAHLVETLVFRKMQSSFADRCSHLNQLNLILYNIITHPIMHGSLHVYETAVAAIYGRALYIYRSLLS